MTSTTFLPKNPRAHDMHDAASILFAYALARQIRFREPSPSLSLSLSLALYTRLALLYRERTALAMLARANSWMEMYVGCCCCCRSARSLSFVLSLSLSLLRPARRALFRRKQFRGHAAVVLSRYSLSSLARERTGASVLGRRARAMHVCADAGFFEFLREAERAWDRGELARKGVRRGIAAAARLYCTIYAAIGWLVVDGR